DMDFNRVYASDMKKMIKWFDVLTKNNIEIKLSEPPEEEEPVIGAQQPEPESEKDPKKKPTRKKKAEK
ncbi:MAG: DUF5606 domain-containing protein, partial [Chitinophagaceae bacterium]